MRDGRFSIKRKDFFIFLTLVLIAIQYAPTIPICRELDEMGLKHISVLIAIFVGLAPDFTGLKIRLKNYSKEIKSIMFAILSLLIISLVYMCINGFATYWISETYFLVAPLLFVYVIFRNDCSLSRFKWAVGIIYWCTVPLYFIYVAQVIISGPSLAFSFSKSTSPFEQSAAHLFLLIYIFYTFCGDKKKRLISGICCVFAWKRMCLVYLVLVTLIDCFIPNLKKKNVPKSVIIIVTAVMAAVPLLIQLIMTDAFSTWFYNLTGLDLEHFVMFRFQTIGAIYESNLPSQGLGTFLNIDVPWYGQLIHMNPHNDVIRLYEEVSIIGLIIFVYKLGSICTNWYSFVAMGYIFIELAVSHFLGNGGLPLWIMVYLMVFCFNTHANRQDDKFEVA